MRRSIYDTMNELRNKPVRNVTVVDNNGNVTVTNTGSLKNSKKKKVKNAFKSSNSFNILTGTA